MLPKIRSSDYWSAVVMLVAAQLSLTHRWLNTSDSYSRFLASFYSNPEIRLLIEGEAVFQTYLLNSSGWLVMLLNISS
jgi:hypothetical protein